ncbi:MAG: hypothetical protein DWC07_04740 [Candidatus Poseidoniales archaeon]|nr:MAG: hypothetical protein DWC07_04740 [Candidatus Poseidoniales archaeon]
MAYRLLQVLEKKGVSPVLVDVSDPLPDPDGWWFGTPREVETFAGNGVAADAESVNDAVEEWWRRYRKRPTIQRLVVGIDPGPRPGCAWLGDDAILGKTSLESIEAAVHHVRSLKSLHGPIEVLVRVGHGAPVQRDRFINAALQHGWSVEVVNEHRTSQGGSRHEHEASALKIAQKSGDEVREWRTIAPTDGEVKDWQRRSRRASKGAITISTALATAVCMGAMTMAQALLASGYSSSGVETAD